MPILPKPRKTVLVVDDDPLIRMLAADMVTDAGFAAIEAHNADEAIEVLEANPDVSVIFTDVDMPGSMYGVKLAHVVRDRWPPIRIIVVSGYTTLSQNDLPEGGLFFRKPYIGRDIARALNDLAA